MDRLLTRQLINWKNQPVRKPLLLDGARQVGKSYLVEQLFGGIHFPAVHRLDFLAEPTLENIFADSLEPEAILDNLEIRRNISIDPATDLIFFDEVGECQAAVESLKYFAERMPEAYICGSGSNIGLLDSFPVGKVQLLELFPMSFEEFLMAAGNQGLLKAFRTQSRQLNVHEMLWSMLLDYYFVGGMPEAVDAWYNSEGGINQRCQRVKQIHEGLIAGYTRDFGKYSGKTNAQQIESVFLNIPRQLSRSMDGSVRRFFFKDVIEKKRRYAELQGPIDWLEKAKLASKCYPIGSKPLPPLPALVKENIFKLFLFDVGLLGYMLNMEYADQLGQKVSYKGYIAENFVQNEFRSQLSYPTYSWEEARGEIEFLHRCQDGEVIPVEVKSGSRTRARSLRTYVERYAPSKTVKLIGAAGGNDQDSSSLVWPLYYAKFLKQL